MEAESQQYRASTEDLRTELRAASKPAEKIVVREDLKVFGLGVILFAAGALVLSMGSASAYALFGSLILIVAGLVCFVLGFVYKYFGE